MKDTFTSVFPLYTHGERSVGRPSHTHAVHSYKETNDEGSPTHLIDRTYTYKLDALKMYTEEMLKLANMRRPTK
jgi:hypothetical protein